jgi:hypothetical protein
MFEAFQINDSAAFQAGVGAPRPGRVLMILAGALSAFAVGASTPAGPASAAPVLHPNGVTIVDDSQSVLYHGQRYCWYDTAWRGPGWYLCGYAWRNGLGWGGGYGWHNWPRGHQGHNHPGGHHHGGPRPGPGKPGPGKPGGKPPVANPPGGHHPGGGGKGGRP